MLEDTLIFVSIGLPALWVMLPRIVLAIAAVWIQRLIIVLKEKNIHGHATFHTSNASI
jgi:hypothetical protein